MTEPGTSLSPDRAAAVWRRAAQLQAEAAQRLEERSRTLAVAGHAPDADPHDFTPEEVRAAALEAGIAPEFVTLALAEGAEAGEAGLSSRGERAATRWLGVAHRSLEVARTVDRPAAQVYEAMQRVLPGHPWLLSLRDVTGDPLAGGILVFDVPEYTIGQQLPLAYHALATDVRQLQVMLRPVPGRGGEACEVVVSVGLRRSVRRNFKTAGWMTGILGGMGAGGGAAIAGAAGVAGGILALPAVAGLALLGGGTALGYRALYRNALRNLTEVLERMLQGVDVHARTGGAFVPAPRPSAGGEGPGDGGASVTAAIIASTGT